MKALREYLERTGTTQAAFAERLGVSQAAVSDWINGVHSASAKLLKRISQETRLSVDELLADDTPVPSTNASVVNHLR